MIPVCRIRRQLSLTTARMHTLRLRHTPLVRVTHWITTACFLALMVSGTEIVISHPRFYWGKTGNVRTPSLFDLPIPASRARVNTGYGFVLADQNGWSRSLHFQSAWLLLFTGALYTAAGLLNRHFRDNLLPAPADLRPRAFGNVVAQHLKFRGPLESGSYNVLQRVTYLVVLFLLFPLIVWTGLAMSPAITSAWPAIVTVLGGHQSARTLHFFVTLALVLFVLVHLAMVIRAGFKDRTRAMITGRVM
jgi:thiosulfate reductase cytochrome b subunit